MANKKTTKELRKPTTWKRPLIEYEREFNKGKEVKS